MILSDISIRRPVLATVMSLMIILVGLIAFDRLPVREYPNIDAPVVSVRTVYTGASAAVMESQITKPLEDSLSGIEGIRTIKSVSREAVSQITVEFVQSRDPEAAANDTRDRVARVRGLLPNEAEDPVVAKIEADAQAIIWLAFSSDRQSPLEITDYADRVVADQPENPAGRRLGDHRRTAPLRHAAVARPQPPGRAGGDGAGRGNRVQEPEHRTALGADRRPDARIHRAGRNRPQDAGGIRARHHPRQRRRYWCAWATSGVPKSAPPTTQHRARQRPRRGRPGHRQAVDRQHAGGGAGGQGRGAAIEAELPEGMQMRVGFDSSIFIEKSIDLRLHHDDRGDGAGGRW
jgi:multidrug efflux pump